MYMYIVVLYTCSATVVRCVQYPEDLHILI